MDSSKLRALAGQFDELAAGLEELAEDLFNEEDDDPLIPDPMVSEVSEPVRVGDIVEIIAPVWENGTHVGKRGPVVKLGLGKITVLLPMKSDGWNKGGQPHYYLPLGTYRVVARLRTPTDGDRSYDYVEVN